MSSRSNVAELARVQPDARSRTVRRSLPEARLLKLAIVGFAVLCSSGSRRSRAFSGDAAKPVAAKKPAAKAETQLATDDVETLFYMASGRLVVIRLHLRVNGKSHNTLWAELTDKYFAELDTNKDGVLTKKELDVLPSQADMMRAGNSVFPAPNRPVRLPTVSRNAADSNPKDGRVTKQELKAYLKRIGARPFSVRIGDGNSGQRVRYVYGGGNPEDAGKTLFARLDTNDDGKLSRRELRAAAKSLRKTDLDEDGTISAAELSGPRSPYAFAIRGGTMRPAGSGSPFLSLSSSSSAVQLTRRLIRKYDATSDGKLSKRELGLDAKTFDRYDADDDGVLDFTELRQFLANPPPGMELVVRLGRRKPGEKLIELARVQSGLKSRVKEVTAQLANLALKDSQIDIGADRQSWEVGSTAAGYDQQFKFIDADNNGYIDRNESRRSSIFRNAFDRMDADRDGKVFKKEMHAYFRRQENLMGSQTFLDVSDQGRDLFKILDLNRDNRLSAVELEAAVGRINAWDADGDKQVAKAEIPRQYRLSLARGRPGGIGAPLVAFAPGGGYRPAGDAGPGPKWFSRMDLNNDGEVSRREFLGTPAVFAKLDADHNGRLTRREAEAAAQGK